MSSGRQTDANFQYTTLRDAYVLKNVDVKCKSVLEVHRPSRGTQCFLNSSGTLTGQCCACPSVHPSFHLQEAPLKSVPLLSLHAPYCASATSNSLFPCPECRVKDSLWDYELLWKQTLPLPHWSLPHTPAPRGNNSAPVPAAHLPEQLIPLMVPFLLNLWHTPNMSHLGFPLLRLQKEQ